MNICANCRFCQSENIESYCFHPQAIRDISIFSGVPIRMSLWEMRSTGLCKKEGFLFEEKTLWQKFLWMYTFKVLP